MEEKKENNELMQEAEFEEHIHSVAENNKKKIKDDFEKGIIYLHNFYGVGKYKSIRRAIKRGHVSIFGDIYPNRPYNNRKRGKGTDTYVKRNIYEQLTNKEKI